MICFLIGTQNHDFLNQLTQIFKSVKNKKIILIVPEQYSFYAEKQMIKVFKQLKIEIEVLSFSRLTNKIFKKFGQPQKIVAQKADKIATLNLTIFNLKNELSAFDFLVNKPDFAELLLQTIEQIKNNHSNILTLKNKLKYLQTSNLKLKVDEFFLIYKTYCLKLASNFHDPSNDNNLANKICNKFKNFKTVEIFFSNFSYFSKSQLDLIQTMIKQTNVFFAFRNIPGCDIFQQTTDTISQIKNIAQQLEIEFTTIQIEKKLKKSKTMSLVEKILINPKLKNEFDQNHKDNLKIFAASSIFSEIDWAIAETIKFAQTKKNTFSDIAILSANFKAHKIPLVCALEKHNIPFFLDDPISFQTMPLIKCCKNLICAANHITQLVNCCLLILKTNLTQFSTVEVAVFENFILSQNINSKNFFSNFKIHFQDQSIEKNKIENELNLEIVTKIQSKLKQAIKKIKNSENSSKQLALNLIDALEILETGNKIENKIEQNNFKTQWNSLIFLLETIFKSTNKQKISHKQFEFLFNATAKNLNTKKIPPTLNCLLVGSIEQTFPNEPKLTIILGANDSNLPRTQVVCGQFFSDAELNNLRKLKINFGQTLKEQNNINSLIAHQAVCGSSHKLLISFLANQSDPCCNIITTLKNFFKIPILDENNCSSFLDKCLTEKMAFETFALIHSHNTTESKLLEQYFKKNKAKIFKSNSSQQAKKNKKILPKTISPSQIEQFFTCPRSYFFKYILNIRPNSKFELNKKNIGICFHKILEQVVHSSNFTELNKNNLEIKIKTQMLEYLNSQSQINYWSPCQLNLFKKKYCEILQKLCENIQLELKTTNFKPEKFEYSIMSNESDTNNLKINLSNGTDVKISGKIDRIDIKPISKNTNLFRIIDYKTGDRSLSYSNLIHGLNLQLLIYLMVITQNSSSLKKLVPAEITYVKILGNLTTYKLNTRNPSPDQIEKTQNDGFFQNGLIFSNENNSFSKATTTTENRYINNDELKILFNFIKLKIKKMLRCIEHCDFTQIEHHSNSKTDSTQTNCSLCAFKEACDPNSIQPINHISKLNKFDFFNLVMKELENEL